MTPRRPPPSSVTAGARQATLRLRWAVLGGAGVTAVLWLLLAPLLSALPAFDLPLYGAAALLLGTVLFLAVALSTGRIGGLVSGRPGGLFGAGLPDEIVAPLSVGGLGTALALAFALFWRGRTNTSWAAALFCLQAGLAITVALAVGVMVHRVRAPLRALAPVRPVEEGGGALSYSTALGVLATGLILGGWLLCTGSVIGHGQAQGTRRSAVMAADLAAVVAGAAVHESPAALLRLLGGLGPSTEPGGFVVLLDATGAVVPLSGQSQRAGERLVTDSSGTLCRLLRDGDAPVTASGLLPCAVRALPELAGAEVKGRPQPLRIAVAILSSQSTLPFLVGAFGAALLIAILGLLLGRAVTVDSVQDLARLAEDIDGLDGSRGAQGLLRALGSPTTPEIGQLQGALARLRARLFDEVCRYEKDLARAEDADRRKTEFIRDVGRELRAPLEEILKDVRHLLTGDDGALSDKQRDDVHIIQQGAQHLLELLRDVLDLSVLQGGLRLGQRAPVDVAIAAREILRSMRPLVNEQAVALRVEVQEGTPTAHADGPALRRILGNLLSNAVKFTTHGEIIIEIAPERMEDGRPAVRVQVRDTGPGIPSADLHKLFTEFTQLGAPLDHGRGTGLGLAIAKRLCELHDGTIDVKSTLGQGSIFGFTLPASPSPEEDRDAEGEHRGAASSPRPGPTEMPKRTNR